MDNEDVIKPLSVSGEKTAHISSIPKKKYITCINCRFGENSFAQRILNKVDQIISGGIYNGRTGQNIF
jgi:hypothetical protein